jgi:hypothetical protein
MTRADAESTGPAETGSASMAAAGEHTAGRCVLFGCLEEAVWLISDPQGGQLAACDTDLDALLNDALARIPPDSKIRIEVWRA